MRRSEVRRRRRRNGDAGCRGMYFRYHSPDLIFAGALVCAENQNVGILSLAQDAVNSFFSSRDGRVCMASLGCHDDDGGGRRVNIGSRVKATADCGCAKDDRRGWQADVRFSSLGLINHRERIGTKNETDQAGLTVSPFGHGRRRAYRRRHNDSVPRTLSGKVVRKASFSCGSVALPVRPSRGPCHPVLFVPTSPSFEMSSPGRQPTSAPMRKSVAAASFEGAACGRTRGRTYMTPSKAIRSHNYRKILIAFSLPRRTVFDRSLKVIMYARLFDGQRFSSFRRCSETWEIRSAGALLFTVK